MNQAYSFRFPWVVIPIALSLTALALLLNTSALSGYWRWDDPSILLHIHSNSFVSDFIVPEVWQSFSPANLTPWLTFSYEVDLVLFGMNPTLFYGHQIVALSLAAFVLYCLLTLWVRKPFAFFGAALFLTGTPSLLVAQQLMTRHYLEGLVFCLLSLACFVVYLRHRRLGFLVISALLYLLAVTAKETYVPLVLLLPFVPETNLRSRLLAALPHIVIAFLYTLWRGYMLNNLGGGYISATDYLSFGNLANIAGTFLTIPELLFGNYWIAAVFVYLFLFIATAIYYQGTVKQVLLVTFLVLAPLVPLVSFPGIVVADRYLLLPWVAISFSIAFFCDRLSDHFMRNRGATVTLWCSVIGLFAIASVVSGKQTTASILVVAREYDRHGEFIWQYDAEHAYRPTAALLASYWYVTDFTALKSRLRADGSAPHPIVDYYFEDPSELRPWLYQTECDCLVQESTSVAVAMERELARADQNAAVDIEYEYRNGYFDWKFGPYNNGQYHIVSDILGLVPAPPSGSLRVNLDEGTSFYLRYTSPDGWTTYSDEQRITSNAPLTQWERAAR